MSLVPKFENEISHFFQSEKDVKVAVAVSGGSDSLALTLLCFDYLDKNCGKLVALTIDHGLREESSLEAEIVQKLLKDLQITHHILKWEGEKPKSNIQEEARIARYRLLTDFCNENGIKYLLTAHHEDDQAENFIIRAERGAGIYGLAGISKLTEINKIKIFRPLLNFNKKDLQDYLKERNINWIEDPSNNNLNFARVRARKLLAENPAWTKKLATISNNLAKTKEAIDFYVDKEASKLVRFVEDTAIFSCEEFNKLPQEIRFRMLEKLVQTIGKKNKPSRGERIGNLLEKLSAAESFKASTLGSCLIIKKKHEFIIKPEH